MRKENPWYEEGLEHDKKPKNEALGNEGVELSDLVPKEYKDGVTVQRKIRAEPGKNMLLVGGLSTNLTARDFYRLAPNSLADWDSSIKMGMSVLHWVCKMICDCLTNCLQSSNNATHVPWSLWGYTKSRSRRRKLLLCIFRLLIMRIKQQGLRLPLVKMV